MKRRTSLIRRYVRVFGLLIAFTLVLAGGLQLFFGYQDQERRVYELQEAESGFAAEKVRNFMESIVVSLAWVNDFDQPGAPLDASSLRNEAHRLLRKETAVERLRYFDADGCERFDISRFEEDATSDCRRGFTTASARPELVRRAGQGSVVYGPVFFKDTSEPHVEVAVAGRGAHPGILLAEIDLTQIHRTVARIRVGQFGLAYVLDSTGKLIAHPDETLVLRNIDLRRLPQVRALMSEPAGNDALVRTSVGRNLDHVAVLSGATRIEGLNWWVVVEEPVGEAFAPVYAGLWTTLAIILAAVSVALLFTFLLARALARPILILTQGAQRIRAGDLGARIFVGTGDEVELLADEFNSMASVLEQSYSSLEAKVLARTSELAQAGEQLEHQARELAGVNDALSIRLTELAQRKEEAERANAAKSRFLAVASHDLRQPMHAISLLVGILSERIRYPAVSQLVAKVQSSVRAMEDLFNGLLDISKLDAGAVKPTVADCSVQDVFRRIEIEFLPLAVEKGIALKVAGSRAVVRSDPVLLSQMLGNLVSNAVCYTSRGKVLVGCRRLGSELRICVHDTGSGIPEQYKQAIFDEFFQIPGTVRDRSKGLGLGLSIVRRSAELLGHDVAVHSKEGHGAMFEIKVPLVSSRGVIAITDQRTDGGCPRLFSAFVVVIDDDAESRFATVEIFRQWGCHVLSADSIGQALSQLKLHLRIPDLLVSDLRLGEDQDGIAAIRQLRLAVESDIPAILMTGDTAAFRTAGIELTRCELLRKPLSPRGLRELANGLIAEAIPES